MEKKHLDELLLPGAYDEPTSSVRLMQTHVSFLFLTDRHVYKIKKPVDFGFLNFTTLDRRRFYCEEEVRLNRRLCPDMYLGVVELRESPHGVVFHGTGAIIDYAVKMKRLPADRMLDRLLAEGAVTEEDIRRVARNIGRFHLDAERGAEIDVYGKADVIRGNWEENFRQIAPFVSRTLDDEDLQLLRNWVDCFFQDHGELFAGRVAGGFIRDCDGDIHCENICLLDKVYIFDCIEFNARFRFSDTAADIAFLLMDLEYRGRRDLGLVLLDEYLAVTGDYGMVAVLDFYLVYRAVVRGKVESFRLDDPQIAEMDKRVALEDAARHFRLARGFILRPRLSPAIIVFCGLMGAGKSTLARELSFELGVELLVTDAVRKELAGISTTERRHDGYNQGIYTAEFTRATYREMFRRAEAVLSKGRSVILDASFAKRADRAEAADLARRMGVKFFLFHAVCSEELARRRLEARAGDSSEPSDGRWELYVMQQRDFESPAQPDETWHDIDTSVPICISIRHSLHILGVLSNGQETGKHIVE